LYDGFDGGTVVAHGGAPGFVIPLFASLTAKNRIGKGRTYRGLARQRKGNYRRVPAIDA
jgi:hypothetical protein